MKQARALGLRPARNRKEWVRLILLWEKRLAPELPHIDPHDLGLILHEVFKPLSVPRFRFVRFPEVKLHGS